MKEYIVIRSLLAALKSGAKRVGVMSVSCLLATAGALQAQNADSIPLPLPSSIEPAVTAPATPTPVVPSLSIVDPMVKQASGCAGCGLSHGGGGCANGACGRPDYGRSNTSCVPGRSQCCSGIDTSTFCGRLIGGFCEELCCPDPCYEPRWIPEANAAFFQDSPRPVTQTRIRWDSVFDYRFPDTSEFLWAKAPKGPKALTPNVRYNDLTLYQEIAAKGASVFTEIGYRTVDPAFGPGGSGMTDMNVGVKTVLVDREILLISMQFRTYIPTGNFTTGVGTGHVSLEPSLLAALKLCQHTYLQTELSEWIPIGGAPGFASSVFHYHFSLNHRLLHWGDCVNVVGTAELNGFNFQGAFTDFPSGAIVGNNGSNYLNAGPGVRVQICDRIDFGFASAFGFGNRHGPGQIYRTEMRVRF
jgi:hypothetical protein